MKFGKSTADLAEIGVSPFPILFHSEYELRGTIGWVPMLWYLDSAHEFLNNFYEYKTGKEPWTQDKVNSHGQMYIYAILIEQYTGVIPEAKLIWARTENKPDWTIWFTGDMMDYIVEWDESLIDYWKKEIPKIWSEIQETHRVWEENQWKPQLEPTELQEYASYIRQIKELQSKADELKPFLSALLDEKGSKITTSDGSLYYTEKKTYEYPDKIKKAEELIDKAKEDFKKTAIPKVSKSLTFKLC